MDYSKIIKKISKKIPCVGFSVALFDNEKIIYNHHEGYINKTKEYKTDDDFAELINKQEYIERDIKQDIEKINSTHDGYVPDIMLAIPEQVQGMTRTLSGGFIFKSIYSHLLSLYTIYAKYIFYFSLQNTEKHW